MRTIQSELQKHGIKISHKKKFKPKKNSTKLSERELKDLMGVNRPTYTRHKGAFRQK